MTDEQLTRVHVDLPNHWATGGESLWARQLGADRFRIENVPFYAYDLNYSYESSEARVPGSLDDVPEDEEPGNQLPAS